MHILSKPHIRICLVLFILSSYQYSFAKVSLQQQAKLGQTLTPIGAVKAGNGSEIPDWNDNTNKLHAEKPLFIINRENFSQYTKYLTNGQRALFEKYPNFYMSIYPTHRTAKAPQWVYDNTIANAITTQLNQDNTGYENNKAGIPFPIPQSALEIYFNHISRWRGLQVKTRASDAVVYADGKFSLYTRQSIIRFDGYNDNIESKYFISLIAKVLAPATKSGSGVLLLEPLDQINKKRSSWLFDKGRRRVVRAPNITYDSPVQSANGLRTVDDTDLINGAPDRFNWKILPKRECYIPYNNERLASKSLKYNDILHKNHINPELTRYELHRVWVIEATLKPKWRHIYSKRVFYIDEDTWQVIVADQYDKQGKIWRVSMSYTKFYPQMPGIYPVINVFHDLNSNKYHVMNLQNQENSTIQFNGEIVKNNLFTPSGFKRFMK